MSGSRSLALLFVANHNQTKVVFDVEPSILIAGVLRQVLRAFPDKGRQGGIFSYDSSSIPGNVRRSVGWLVGW